MWKKYKSYKSYLKNCYQMIKFLVIHCISYVIRSLNQLEFRFNMLRGSQREFFIKNGICGNI